MGADDGNRKIDVDTQHLGTAVIADILDSRGLRDQALSPEISPLEADDRLFGRAFTVQAQDSSVVPADPYRKELEAVASLEPGDVMVAAILGAGVCGFWGELLTTAAIARGATAAVIDGFTRDSRAIRALGFPVFVRGCCPLDSKARVDVIGYGESIECGGVRVNTGDYVFGDADGVVVIPGAHVDDVLSEANHKVSVENKMRTALAAGMGILEAYERFGVL